jgi:hypothetical protein
MTGIASYEIEAKYGGTPRHADNKKRRLYFNFFVSGIKKVV